jgi:protein TonB
MHAQRLSYGTAGADTRTTPLLAPRLLVLPRTPAALAAPGRYGEPTPARSRRRRAALALLLLVHGAAILGLLQASYRREVAVDAKPLFLAVLPSLPAPTPSKALPPPPDLRMPAPPLPQMPVVAHEPSPVVAETLPAPAPVPAATVAAAEPVAPPAPAAPRVLPAAAVQFLVPPAPVYSRVSARMRESGKALLRVFIDEAGLPRTVLLVASTGFARLDDSAVTAVRNARFKPYVENGVAVAGWASIPIEFELPQ